MSPIKLFRKPEAEVHAGAPDEPVFIFILTYNRPIYLWCTLDSVYRNTKHPAKIVIADNASWDPLVGEVIQGFSRRGMFHAVHMCDENRPDRLEWMIEKHRSELGEFFAFVECDVLIQDSAQGWLPTMISLMRRNPKLYMLGSSSVPTDFVDPAFARTVEPDMPRDQLDFLIKPDSPERHPPETNEELIEPHNPPGRLLLFRTDILSKAPLRGDLRLYDSLKDLGLEAKISTAVRHRHLSWLNFYDYHDYDSIQRARFFAARDENDAPLDKT